jgi:ATP-dependent Clp protease ATP-binding subunit ClpX
MERKNFFGIFYSPDIKLESTELAKFSMLLFCSFYTTSKEAKTISIHKNLISIFPDLKSSFSSELKNVMHTIDKKLAHYSSKLIDWIDVFTFPTDSELLEAEQLLFLPKGSLLQVSQNAQLRKLDSPSAINDYLNKYIIGQESATRSIALLIYNHIQKATNKQNIVNSTVTCIIGDSGGGKTYLTELGIRVLHAHDIQCITVSCAELTRPGIFGRTIEDVSTQLHQFSGENITKTSHGVIIFDEVDKLAVNDQDSLYKYQIQYQLLKLLDRNATITFPESFKPWSNRIEITNDFLVICSGAFFDIASIIENRLICEHGEDVKFMNKDKILQHVCQEDLIQYGFIPELAGRLSNLIGFNKLNTNDIYNILKYSKESLIVIHTKQFNQMGMNLYFEDESLHMLATECKNNKLGIRYLAGRIQNLLSEYYYSPERFHGEIIIITPELISTTYCIDVYDQLFADFDVCPDLAYLSGKYNATMDEMLELYSKYNQIKKIRL